MKRLLVIVAFLLGLFSFASAAVVDDAVSRMYVNGLTIHDNTTDFDADRGLRRDEAAKFYVNFAKLLGKTTYVKTASQCVFSDINDSRSDLKTIVIESCRLGLFQGNKGKFSPQDQLTNAQAITVLVRLLAGNQSEVGISHWADNYYNEANQLGILEYVNMNSKDTIASRANVGVIIYNGNNLNTLQKNTTNTCVSEGGIVNQNIRDENCCQGLSYFEYYAPAVSSKPMCYNPDKGLPECKYGGTSEEGRYYKDNTPLYLKSENPIGFYPCNELNTPTQREVLLYYHNIEKDKAVYEWISFNEEFILPVTRNIAISKTPIKDTFTLLFEGKLTKSELGNGFRSIPFTTYNLMFKSIVLNNGILKIVFNDPYFNVENLSSAESSIFINSLKKTAAQFPEIEKIAFENGLIFDVKNTHIEVISPNGGEQVTFGANLIIKIKTNINNAGYEHQVTLVDELSHQRVSLDSLLPNRTFTQQQIKLGELSMIVDMNKYQHQIPVTLSESPRYKIEVCVNGHCDKSDNLFSIPI